MCQVRGLEQERALFEAQIWIHSKHLKDPTPPTLSLSALSWVHVFIIFKRERERERHGESVEVLRGSYYKTVCR